MPKKPILVIEDDLAIRQSYRDILELEGYEVVTAENGMDGLEKMRSSCDAGLVLLDMMMPVMDGREFLDHVLSDQVLAQIPVILVSADANPDNSHGARSFLRKPFDLNRLIEIVNQYAT